MPEQNLTTLGFDFGTSWIGVAIGQTTTRTASPLKPLRNKNNRPDWDRIQELIHQWQPDLLVVGLPLKMNDDKTDMTDRARRFSRQLEGRFQLKTQLIDERLTTREAWQILEQSAQKKMDKPDIDSIAAVLITETWLNQQS